MMFAIAVEFLMGWSMAASDGARKQHAEWPPHPDRLFMALAAAWFETGCEEAEGDALRWLEVQSAPMLSASAAESRTPITHFVPVNDAEQSARKVVDALVALPVLDTAKAKVAGLGQLPQWRNRQPRGFPVATPHDPVVHFLWTAALPEDLRAPLSELCSKLSCIGHSASLVRAWIEDSPPEANWLPGEGLTAVRLRVPGPGRLRYLDQRFNSDAVQAYATMCSAVADAKGKAKKELETQLVQRFPQAPVTLRPEPGLWQSYVRPQPERFAAGGTHSVFDDRLVVLALGGQRIGLQTTLRLTAALRGALMANCAAPLPSWLSGHEADGARARDPHLALLPLAYTSAVHADGRLLGVALALPRAVPTSEVARVLLPVLHDEFGQPRALHLFDGQALDCTVTLERRERPPLTLGAEAWVGPARRWASVTPVVLDRHLDGADRWERAAEVVADACERIGLPRPVDVVLHPNTLHAGVPPASGFAPLTRKNGGGRLAHTHVLLTFNTEVVGPVTLGAGRFRGYGLCRPVREGLGHE